MEKEQNIIIKVQGKVVKVESSKKGYGYTLKDLAGKQSYFYNNWKLNIFLRQDYIFYLNIKPGQNKYYYLYQSHKLVSPIKSAEAKTEPTELHLHKEQEAQEQKHEASQVRQLEVRVKQLELEKQQLKNLLGNNVSYLSFVINQQVKAIKAKPNKLTQWDQEHLKSCKALLSQFHHQARELKVQGIATHIYNS